MKTKTIIALIICHIISIAGYSQTYPKPNEPIFDYLTINLTTGNPTLYWTAPTYNPQYPNPIGYIIYKRFIDALGNDNYYAIDTVNATTLQYTDANANGNQSRLFYKLASLGPTEPSRMIHNTLKFGSHRYTTAVCKN
jgi:hypothetical protein